MESTNEFCGEAFYVWENQYFGHCFLRLCFIYPAYIFLIITSSYFMGFKKLSFSLRTNCERSLIYFRMFVSISFSFLFCYKCYAKYTDADSKIASVDLIQVILTSSAWLLHMCYLQRLLCGITYKMRGPKIVTFSVCICFLASILDLYMQCKSYSFCFDNYSIAFVILQILYIITLLPQNAKRHERIFAINSSLGEQQPLIHSVLSRYYGGDVETNPLDLGVAEDTSNILSKIFFYWVQSLMLKGYNKNLKNVEDLYDLPMVLQANYLYDKFMYNSVEFDEQYPIKVCGQEVKVNPLVAQLHKLLACEFYSIGILKFMADTLAFGGPLLLNALVSFLESSENKASKVGYYYALGLFLVTLFSTIFSVWYGYLVERVSLKMRAVLIMIVYQKTLLLSKVSLSTINTGEILNFISTDTERIVNFCRSFHQFWSLPIQVIIALVLLYQQLNYCFIIGVIFLIVIIPINQHVAKKIGSYSKLMMMAKDKRMKIMNEIISGIRIIKMNSWEKLFSQKANYIRNNEVKYLKKRKYLDALCVYFWATTPVLMSFLSFALFASLGYTLTASKVFTSIALFNILIQPLNAFPWVLNGLIEAWISVKRVSGFLQLENLDLEKFYTNLGDEHTKLEIVNGIFTHNHSKPKTSEETSLENISCMSSDYSLGPIKFKISKGDFICVIGKVGSGKSSLLSSILADMNCISGCIKVNTSEVYSGIGYVSQEPWIQQRTIKDNILFGKTLNILKYRKILEACALVDDLEALPYGDETEVGDKGVTLSGGQKARIALARAVYQDFDIYLLDDALSAVDVHVAEHIFSNCIMGLLKSKTRILCTHKTKFAENADSLMVLSDGKVVSQGPPSQVLHVYLLNDEDENGGENGKETSKTSEDQPLGIVDSHSLILKEEKEEGVVKLQVYKTYWRSVGSVLPIIVLLFCLLMQGSKTISDWWLSFWISSIHNSNCSSNFSLSEQSSIPEEDEQKSLLFFLGIYGGLAAGNSIFSLFRAFLFAFAGIKAAVSLHNILISKVMKAKSCFFDVTPLGRIMNRFSSDVYTIDDSFPFMLNILLAQIMALAGCIIITCYGLPFILIPIAVLSVIYCKIQKYYRYTSRELKRLSSISLSPIYAHFSETLDGQATIRAMSATTWFQKENIKRIDCNLQALLAAAAASQWLNLRLQFFGVIIVTSVALIALFKREFGEVDPGLVGLALSYALSVTTLLNGSITSFTETEKEIVSVERVMQYIGVDSEVDQCSLTLPFAWPSYGVISFANVRLRYRPSLPYALKGITFETRPGEKIGVVGRTGSGKSSLIQVLFRMIDDFEGTVLVDGINIRNLELKKLRSNLSVIPQQPFLFSGTIRENLDPFLLHSNGQIWKALKDCHIYEKIFNMGGLDIEVEEQGQNFSIGEKQLLCLARALLRKTKILCMDEATASIDYYTDSLIRHTVRMAFRRSTIIVIAHRTETVLDCDRVMIMKEGQIVEMDKPSVLLENTRSEFYKLVYSKTE